MYSADDDPDSHDEASAKRNIKPKRRRCADKTPTTAAHSAESSEWQTKRARWSTRHVPDWCVNLLQPDWPVDQSGVPLAEHDGITWHINGRRAGWAARFQTQQAFYPLNDLGNEEAYSLARIWLEKQQTGETVSEPAALTPGVKGVDSTGSSIEDESPPAPPPEGGSMRRRSSVSGIAFIKNSWKARWRDVDGKQRMRTFGPSETDQLNAEVFVTLQRESVAKEKLRLKALKRESGKETCAVSAQSNMNPDVGGDAAADAVIDWLLAMGY